MVVIVVRVVEGWIAFRVNKSQPTAATTTTTSTTISG